MQIGLLASSAGHPSALAPEMTKEQAAPLIRDRETGHKNDTHSTLLVLNKPHRFFTLEFGIYYAILLAAFYVLILTAWHMSSGMEYQRRRGTVSLFLLEDHPNYAVIRRYLSPGWICGRLVDNSDGQFRDFRNNFPKLTALMLGYVVLGYAFVYLYLFIKKLLGYNAYDSLDARENPYGADSARTSYYPSKALYNAVVSIALVVVLHGSHSLLVFFFMTINYAIAKIGRGSRGALWTTWIWNIFVLFVCEELKDFKFSLIMPFASFIDAFPGLFSAWYIIFKVTMLRMVSFNMDYYYFFHPDCNTNSNPGACRKCTSTDPCDKHRCTTSHSPKDYSMLNYFGYTLYLPLYFSGPILTFNDYLSQLKHKPSALNKTFVLVYGVRLSAVILFMELIMHYLYVIAIKNAKMWDCYSPMELFTISFINILLVWLKLMVIWRFSRFWAMADGLLTAENMDRCMLNHYSGLGFWRAWHRSFNLWIIRYIYIPLGGNATSVYNIWIIFTFVAFWHDRTFSLFAWAWLVSLFIVPEIILKFFVKKYKMDRWKHYRHMAAFLAGMNGFIMAGVNSVGFGVGFEGIKATLLSFLTLKGAATAFELAVVSYANAHVLFEIREMECRHGIYKNY